MIKPFYPGILLSFSLLVYLPVFAASVSIVETEVTQDNHTETKTDIVTIEGDKARLDFLGTDKEKADNTPYLLTVDGGISWILGNTYKDKFYCARVDPVDFFRKIGSRVSTVLSIINPDIFELNVKKTKEGTGPNIGGYSTTHVQLVTTALGKTRLLFKKFEYKVKITDDIWYSKELEIEPFRKRWIEALIQTGNTKLDKLSIDSIKEIPGSILKRESEIIITNVVKNETKVQKEKVQIISRKNVESNELPEKTFLVPKCKKINQKQLESTAKDMLKEGKTLL